jgi:transposase InsO family protein
VWITTIRTRSREVLVVHRNAPLSETGRLRLARCVVEDGWPLRRAAERFQVSPTTAARWAARYRQDGAAGMADRSSRPRSSPARTPARTERRIIGLRVSRRLGPARIAFRLGLNPSTVHKVLARYRCPRLAHLDRATGAPVRRYEREQPGELVHVDVKKLGNIPDGGGWRYVGRRQGDRNRSVTPDKPRNAYRGPKMGTAFVHTVIDDHSRVAYAEIHDDETATTATAVLRNAVVWFGARGVAIERVLSDNGPAYKSRLWTDTCAELGITVKKTRPYRPQTNGKIERFHRTLADGWAFKRFYNSETSRRAALPAWIHEYNHHRPHTAIGKATPITRLTNLPGQYT